MPQITIKLRIRLTMVRRDTGWLDSRRHDDDTLAYMTGETGSGTTILI